MDRNKINDIIRLITEAPSPELSLELLELLLTHNELEQLSARYDIVKGLLAKNITQRQLATSLHLSIANITRGSNELKRRSNKLISYLTHFFATKDKST